MKACSDTGPILHLNEINKVSLLKIFSKVFISNHIRDELAKHNIKKLSKNVIIEKISKDQVALISEAYDLNLGEASVIYLCKSLKIPLLLTDDLDAREIAIYLDIKPIGTIGIISRCFREKKITEKQAIESLKEIHQKSSLFITSNLIDYAINEIKKYKKSKI